MVFGKQVRLNRLLENGRMLCVPMDHGVSVGPVQGLEQIDAMMYLLEEAGVTALLAHKGVFRSLKRPLKVGSIMHLSGSTQLSSRYNRKVAVASVEEALRLGVDAVSVHINVGGSDDDVMLQHLGETADACDEWQVPLIAMMYPRGENIKDANDPWVISHVARVGAELGADIVKTPLPSANVRDIEKIVKSVPAPIVAAGGPKMDRDEDVLRLAYAAVAGGCLGITFGRNVFQHRSPADMVKALRKIVLENRSVEEALSVLTP
ncbi:MAG: 2-amino-3,7-dideoxy-D-threo-hept-6-ulosonate synthase [Candidatus Caldarchaeum sp.]|nr:2-amino-3,7-dideoxy-D-threo-hept-6-ulosonate synthase [Candidatus Caldarchaeum sp.]MCX8201540.1 2-amino-3,7-dideoxy-D-threo-hept-6-ulosonate synthase [Candidatus Caldarchaeum sp.]MDW8063538.1 2-amino-3,7-dideoxy-D-threo-hept-6-ulosonate synthase [Candidatus Caldarchaeum sp.]MDW8434601.1 2-amino-3,7-dideoxy-D-threo-hept-6-ulosonate synthase [Candidatus Caldarchaeum sp.]